MIWSLYLFFSQYIHLSEINEKLMVMIITVIYGVSDQERRYPYFTKKSPDLSPQGLPGLAWREEKKCKSTPYNGQYSNICKSTLYRGQYLLQHHHNWDPSDLVLVVISVLKILLFTVNTSLITNLSKWCVIYCFNSNFVFL